MPANPFHSSPSHGKRSLYCFIPGISFPIPVRELTPAGACLEIGQAPETFCMDVSHGIGMVATGLAASKVWADGGRCRVAFAPDARQRRRLRRFLARQGAMRGREEKI